MMGNKRQTTGRQMVSSRRTRQELQTPSLPFYNLLSATVDNAVFWTISVRCGIRIDQSGECACGQEQMNAKHVPLSCLILAIERSRHWPNEEDSQWEVLGLLGKPAGDGRLCWGYRPEAVFSLFRGTGPANMATTCFIVCIQDALWTGSVTSDRAWRILTVQQSCNVVSWTRSPRYRLWTLRAGQREEEEEEEEQEQEQEQEEEQEDGQSEREADRLAWTYLYQAEV